MSGKSVATGGRHMGKQPVIKSSNTKDKTNYSSKAGRSAGSSSRISSDSGKERGPTVPNLHRHHGASSKGKSSCQIDSLPNEVLLTIFSMLGPHDLLVTSRICRKWNVLSNDNILWKKIYLVHSKRFIVKKKERRLPPVPADPPLSFWKAECLRQSIEFRDTEAFRTLGKQLDPYSCMPKGTVKAFTDLKVSMVLSLVVKSGSSFPYICKRLYKHRLSVGAEWHSVEFSSLDLVTEVKVHAAKPIFADQTRAAAVKGPRQHSLLLRFPFSWNEIKKREADVSDGTVSCYFLPYGLLMGVFKDGGELAFFSGSFHWHHMISRCLLGTRQRDWDVPERENLELSGTYRITLELRGKGKEHFSHQFPNVYPVYEPSSSQGGLSLPAIVERKRSQHIRVKDERLCYHWKSELFQSTIEDFCIMDVVVLNSDDYMDLHLTVPVKVEKSESSLDYAYDGEKLVIQTDQREGSVKMELVRCVEGPDREFVVTDLLVKLYGDQISYG